MKAKTTFFCTECGHETPRWEGRCSSCGRWNTLVEQTFEPKRKATQGAIAASGGRRARLLEEIDGAAEIRFGTGMGELDRVLGGGAVRGSLVLVGGAPGVGKSTLLLQICGHLARTSRVLYVTGEESERQLKLRAERLGVLGGDFFVLAETDIGNVLAAAGEIGPDVVVVDSIQTLSDPEVGSSPGSVGQVRECAMALLRFAKSTGAAAFLVGHINKEGAIAGPKVLEHMVDCVLYFEGEPSSTHRILRAAKNRFGSTNEIGMFDMRETGLVEVPNPSELLLSGRPSSAPGTCVTCVMEGTRPVLAEVQALVAPSCYGVPRRNSNGFDYNRAMMLLAVLEKRGGLRVSGCDAYINVVGGLVLDDPSADLAVALALASSYRDKPIPDNVVAIGEVGLTGELRPSGMMGPRLAEVARLGFGACILPKSAVRKTPVPGGLEVIPAATISEAISLAAR